LAVEYAASRNLPRGCNGNPECFAFTVDTTFDASGGHTSTATSFAIPTSGHVGGTYAHNYNWLVDCNAADSTVAHVESGTGASDSPGIACNYSTPGTYQIVITPNGAATMGWFDAFGFSSYSSGANAQSNKYMFKSIDTPFTNNERTHISHMFDSMFYGAYNADTLPADLFANIDTSQMTDFSYMFSGTFSSYAYNSTTATIPAGLFDSLNTSSGTDFSGMFQYTFVSYANKSTTATIPAGLFNSLNTSNGTNFAMMFSIAFRSFAYNSTIATIPAGLFSSLNTSNGTNFASMFAQTFNFCAPNSTIAAIPDGLFSNLNISRVTSFGGMFNMTFIGFANANDGSGGHTTDINSIWTDGTNSANFAGKITNQNVAYMFKATFNRMKSLTGSAQTFINNYLGGIVPAQPTGTFAGTNVSDLAQLDPNWK
jgi:hypothetical protein